MLSEFRKQKVIRMFEFYDVNENGQIEYNDIIKICNNFCYEFMWEENGEEDKYFRAVFNNLWKQLLKNADANEDDLISLNEFLASYEVALVDDTSFEAYTKPFWDVIYDVLDPHKIGYIAKQDYINFYRAFRNSEKAAEKAFIAMDLNSDGIISKNELYRNFYNFHMSEDTTDRSVIFFGTIPLSDSI